MRRFVDIHNPVNKSANLNKGKIFWSLPLPGLVGGQYIRNIYNDGYKGDLFADVLHPANWGYGGVVPPMSSAYIICNAYSYVNFGSLLLNGLTTCTMSCWMYKTSTGGLPSAFGRDASAGAGRVGIFWYDNTIYWAVDDNGTQGYNTSTLTDVTKWHHLTLVYNGNLAMASRIAAYVNGLPAGLGTYFGTVPSSIPNVSTYISLNRVNGSAASSGPVYYTDMSIWNRALNSTEAFHLYQASRNGYPNELNWIPIEKLSYQQLTIMMPCSFNIFRCNIFGE